ncbi:hypothetical protein TNCV_1449561 [Trichonephila clavipes]|nr:hypothetical protein TNCV_1449561 [Trichonephila clavipes]
MATPGSSFNLTPLGHEDNLGVRSKTHGRRCQIQGSNPCTIEEEGMIHVKFVEAQSPHAEWCGSLDRRAPAHVDSSLLGRVSKL